MKPFSTLGINRESPEQEKLNNVKLTVTTEKHRPAKTNTHLSLQNHAGNTLVLHHRSTDLQQNF